MLELATMAKIIVGHTQLADLMVVEAGPIPRTTVPSPGILTSIEMYLSLCHGLEAFCTNGNSETLYSAAYLQAHNGRYYGIRLCF